MTLVKDTEVNSEETMDDCEIHMICDCFLSEAIENEADCQSDLSESMQLPLKERLSWRIQECLEHQANSCYTSSEESLDTRPRWPNTT